MADIAANVYDVVYPSPIPLRDLSSIVVASQLWLLNLNQHRSKNESEPKIVLRNLIPHVPSAIDFLTSKYLEQLEQSINEWLDYHFAFLFQAHRDNRNDILNYFDDIVTDFDGTVHYTRTAERMMLCDKISQIEKFKIACMYSFEDSIKRIWPSVKSKLNLNELDFNHDPFLYYWMCCLQNELDKIPNHDNIPIDELMLRKSSMQLRSSLEYFWNRTSLQSRYELAKYLYMNSSQSFYGRFILPKLSQQELNAIVAEKGGDLIFYILTRGIDVQYAFPIWMYIKDVMNEVNFTDLIRRMLIQETIFYTVNDPSIEKSDYDKKYHNDYNLKVCCEIWNTAAANLKRSAIENILPDKHLYEKSGVRPSEPKEIRLISAILLDATLEERKSFWDQNWEYFFTSIRVTDFNRLMKLCLKTENEISLFKNNTLAKIENLKKTVETYFERGYFKELSELLDFCWPDAQAARDIKRQFLHSNFLGQSSVLYHGMGYESKSLQEFIDDVYADSPELAADFRNQCLAWLETEDALFWWLKCGHFSHVKEFVTSFATTGLNVERLKKRFADELRDYLVEGSISLDQTWVDKENVQLLQDFLIWCLGSEDEAIKFKQSISSPDEILRNMVQFRKSQDDSDREPDDDTELVNYPRSIDTFMLWYFNTPQEISEFKTRMADVFETLAPPRGRRFQS